MTLRLELAKLMTGGRMNPNCRGTPGFPCPQWSTAKSVCCAGRGADKGPIELLFVGEAPGEDEDEIGLSFVGDAGQFFDTTRADQMPELADDEWHVTNATRCFPGKTPNNTFRKPSAAAMKACASYLEGDVKRLRPRLIVAMGKYATSQVLGIPTSHVKVERMAGQVHQSRYHTGKSFLSPRIPCIVMRHPSWAMRNIPANLPLWLQDWAAVRRWLDTGSTRKDLPGQWRFLTDIFEIESFYRDQLFPTLEAGKTVAMDYETTGLDWWDGAAFMQIGYGLSPGRAVVVKATKDRTLGLHAKALELAKEVVFHNYPFDGTFGLGVLKAEPKGFIWDTKVLAYLTDENASMSLENQVAMRLPHLHGFKDESEQHGGAWGDMSPEVLARRCAYDCMATLQLKELLWDGLAHDTKAFYRNIAEPTLRTLARMKVRGWKLDLPMLDILQDTSRSEAQRLLELIQHCDEARAYREAKALEGKDPGPLNPNSPQQVAELLGSLGIKDKVRQPNNPQLISTSKDVLGRHVHEHWIVEALMEHGTHIGHVERGNHYKQYARQGFLYPGYNYGGKARQDVAAATVTGRLSSARPNVMNPPKLYRRCFISRFPEGKIIQGDYSQLELRIVAILAREEALLQVFRDGGDPHMHSADRIADVLGHRASDDAYADRQIGKRLNFGAVYGAGPGALYEQIQKDALTQGGKAAVITKAQVKQIQQAWWAAHPACDAFMKKLHMAAIAEGKVRGCFGQIRHVPDAASDDPQKRGHALRQLGNFPIQNAGAVITLRAMNEVDRALTDAGMRSMVIGQMHDSVIVDAHPEEVEQVRGVMEQKMKTEMNDWLMGNYLWPIPVDVDFKVAHDMRGSTSIGIKED